MKTGLVFPELSTKIAIEIMTAQGFCIEEHPTTVEATAKIIDREISKPNLGCATTGEIIKELESRSNLQYSTVFWEDSLPPQEAKTEPISCSAQER